MRTRGLAVTWVAVVAAVHDDEDVEVSSP